MTNDKYKNALAHARQAYGSGAYDDATLEAIFPELRESEDERIRRELITALKDLERNRLPVDPYPYLEWVKWLEKQKEQKPAEWSKNDTVFLNEITDFFENKTVRLQHDLDMYAHWLKSLPERFNLQSKQEWSKEDENMRWNIISIVGESKSVQAEEMMDWLKSLPERFNLPSKQEWSEEDEVYLEYTLWCVERAEKSCKDGEDKGACWSARRWLKSLRPSWKPSEEQMKALADTLEDMPEHYKPKCTLESLEKDLKKLM